MDEEWGLGVVCFLLLHIYWTMGLIEGGRMGAVWETFAFVIPVTSGFFVVASTVSGRTVRFVSEYTAVGVIDRREITATWSTGLHLSSLLHFVGFVRLLKTYVVETIRVCLQV